MRNMTINFVVDGGGGGGGGIFPEAFSFSQSLYWLLLVFYSISSQFLSNFERSFHLLPAELPLGQANRKCYFSFLKNLQRCRVTPELELWAFKRLCSEPSVEGEERSAANVQGLYETTQPGPSSKMRKHSGVVFEGKVNIQLATGVESSEWCRILWTSWWIGCKSEKKELKIGA